MKTRRTFAEILKYIDEQGGPAPLTPVEELLRIRVIQERLAQLAIDAAEERWSGFTHTSNRLIERELELLEKTGHA